MTGLGIIETDLCQWASTATPEMIEAARDIVGHPVIKAKPAPVTDALVAGVTAELGILEGFNCWVDAHPVLAGALVVAGYLVLRKR